mmetsp:Transcript_30422/g.55473  ORF Transcript_30422/g.55473 Transcript_30422/m.55473 type:complete len:243 (-) Transcript_30422:957-1685(-)
MMKHPRGTFARRITCTVTLTLTAAMKTIHRLGTSKYMTRRRIWPGGELVLTTPALLLLQIQGHPGDKATGVVGRAGEPSTGHLARASLMRSGTTTAGKVKAAGRKSLGAPQAAGAILLVVLGRMTTVERGRQSIVHLARDDMMTTRLVTIAVAADVIATSAVTAVSAVIAASAGSPGRRGGSPGRSNRDENLEIGRKDGSRTKNVLMKDRKWTRSTQNKTKMTIPQRDDARRSEPSQTSSSL